MSETAPVTMTQAGYARHRGVSRAMVGKWVKAGKISLDDHGWVDAAAADLALGANMLRLNEPAAPAAPAAGAVAPESSGLTKARTETEQYRARRAELELEQLLGRLVDADQVATAAALCAETVVRAVQLAGHAEDVASAAGGVEVVAARAALKRIEFGIRTEIAAAFAKMAADAVARKKQAEAAPVTAAPEQVEQLAQ